jgi:hypothetical protein
VAAVVLASLVLGGPVAAKSSHSSSHKSARIVPSHKTLLTGAVTFWECPSKTTKALIVVNTLTLHRGTLLKINFIVRNEGTKPCNYVAPYSGAAPGPTAATLDAGPCGSIGFEILGSHNKDVWPGVKPFNCPALGFAEMQPNATVEGSGAWTQTEPTGTKRVPAGHYTLVVAKNFFFALTVDSH